MRTLSWVVCYVCDVSCVCVCRCSYVKYGLWIMCAVCLACVCVLFNKCWYVKSVGVVEVEGGITDLVEMCIFTERTCPDRGAAGEGRRRGGRGQRSWPGGSYKIA